jgi:hypothetical protein
MSSLQTRCAQWCAFSVCNPTSPGLVTTTSSFAPGIMKDHDVARFLPYRLEPKGRDALLEWLISVRREKK